jgi:uncharacterized membrane protein
MMRHPQYITRNIQDKFRGGFLIRPLLMSLVLGGIGEFLSYSESVNPGIRRVIPHIFFLPFVTDPQVAQIILSNIATAMMTVVSIVFAVLLMTLTLTSTQFSPRIIMAFVRDRITQQTLGFFLGTFLYCLAALPSTRITPEPFSPAVTVLGAMVLALVCVAWLLFFISHISEAVNVNYLVHRIARETEGVIEVTMPAKHEPVKHEDYHKIDIGPETKDLINHISGYVRYIDTKRLLRFAKQHNIRINVVRRVGHFVPQGVPLLSMSDVRLTPKLSAELHSAFVLGPTRTLENDIEFGILQLVDIGLKAMSPAVNDPSTAITCIDQLSCILIKAATKDNPQTIFYSSPGHPCLSIPFLSFERFVESAFEQIRLYSQTDVAVNLRLLRALIDIASTLPATQSKKQLVETGRLLVAACSEKLGNEVLKEMKLRINHLEQLAEKQG